MCIEVYLAHNKIKYFFGGSIMKFFKGVLVGTMFATGTVMMYREGWLNGNKIMKRSKKIAKKIGIL